MKVTVQYYKYPRTRHWRHELILLGSDSEGTWLGAPPGSVTQRGDEEPVHIRRPFVQLVPSDQWWTAIFNPPDARMSIYVDVTSVPSWQGEERVEMVDFDLDVIKLADGTVVVDDEDEFEEHRRTLRYPSLTVDTARSTAAQLVLALERKDPPFDGSADQWMKRLSGTKV